jgi:hypothetical protein
MSDRERKSLGQLAEMVAQQLGIEVGSVGIITPNAPHGGSGWYVQIVGKESRVAGLQDRATQIGKELETKYIAKFN